MSLLFNFLIMLLLNIGGVALPALLAAWLFTLTLPVPFNEAMWLSLGMLLMVRYNVQNITNIPGFKRINFIEIVISVVIAFIFLALSGLFSQVLLQIVPIGLTLFEATLLFAISLVAGLFFLIRSSTGGLPVWMTLPELEDESFEDNYVVSPSKKQSKRRTRASRR